MKIICVGRNYAAHAAELNNPLPARPVIFLKPDSAILRNGHDFYLPDHLGSIHHELELVFRIKKPGKHISEDFALNYVDALGLGIDFTARELQSELKEKSHPWELAKAFDQSALLGDLLPFDPFRSKLNQLEIELKVNGETRQRGNSGQMLFGLPYIISFVSKYMTLKIGDLIYTGTPSGVGPIKIGDHLEGFLGSEKLLETRIR